MKVEIELDELTDLRNRITDRDETINKLQRKIESLNEPELKRKSIELARAMMRKYITAIFKSLGFVDTKEDVSVSFSHEFLERNLYDRWHEGSVDVVISAHVSERFREAFLKIGLNISDDRG